MEGAIGVNTIAKRRFAVILTDNATTVETPNQPILTAVGCGQWGAAHPEFTFLKLFKVALTENLGDNPYHVEVVAEYRVLGAAETLAPLSRPAVWTFEAVQGERLPALYYYEGNGETRALVNSADDYFEGLTYEEALTQATITQNFAARPSGIIGSFGYVNSDSFAGAGQHHCKHVGSVISQQTEEWNNESVTYWRAESKILFRPTSWNLLVPDVGFNQVVDGQKRRCMVFDFQNSEWIPSPNPVGLAAGVQISGRPNLLVRRVNPEVAFGGLFGTPPA
jgi:hypothetical protein